MIEPVATRPLPRPAPASTLADSNVPTRPLNPPPEAPAAGRAADHLPLDPFARMPAAGAAFLPTGFERNPGTNAQDQERPAKFKSEFSKECSGLRPSDKNSKNLTKRTLSNLPRRLCGQLRHERGDSEHASALWRINARTGDLGALGAANAPHGRAWGPDGRGKWGLPTRFRLGTPAAHRRAETADLPAGSKEKGQRLPLENQNKKSKKSYRKKWLEADHGGRAPAQTSEIADP
jgi:hypothetical protein